MIRLGIIGLGQAAQILHLPNLEKLTDAFRLTAVADISTELVSYIGDKYRVANRFSDGAELIRCPDVDAVMILCGGDHAEYASCLLYTSNVDFDPKMKVRFLSTAETQMLEILKAISYDAKLIIMDEPTSALTEREVQKLFSFIEELKSRQITIIMSTHKIDEVFQIADRVSVLRDGKYIDTKDIQDLDHDKLISMMVGREISNVHPPRNYQGGEAVLQVQHLKCGKKVKDVSFEVHKGEILGFAGIVGAGRTESLRCVFGLDRAESGTISMEGRDVRINCPRDAMKNGIAMVTENRKEDGLVLCRSIMELSLIHI